MALWQRFKRAVRSLFGGAVSSMEDPRLILKQNLRELNDQVPKMNENIATVRANMLMLEKDVKRQEKEVQTLVSKVKAAIQANDDETARRYALRLEKSQETLESTREQLEQASDAYEKAVQVKETFMRERERKIEEAKQALRAHERAQWQSEVADALEQFDVGGLDQTHDEMIQRIRESTAKDEARMELALDSVDTDEVELEEEAEQLRAAQLVKRFRREMGLETRGQLEEHRESEEDELEASSTEELSSAEGSGTDELDLEESDSGEERT